MSRSAVVDDPAFLRRVLELFQRMRDVLNSDRATATTVADLLAIAETSDWIESQARPIQVRLDRVESQRHNLARAAARAQVQA